MRIAAATVSLAGLIFLAGCDEAPPPRATGKAKLTLEIVGLRHEFRDGRHRYGHLRRFIETGGVGVRITRGKVCVRQGKECADALVDYRVEAGKTLEQPNHYVATPDARDVITLEYWAEDDAGNKLTLKKTIRTDGATATAE